MKSRMRKVKMYSRVYAKIDLDAIHHNMEAMHALLKEDTKIFAVIKTDGYGHGAVPIAKEIESLDYLFGYCTATVEEALILRNHGIKKPILILGYTFPEEYEDIVKSDLRPAVFTLEMAQKLSDVAGRLGNDVYVHIKADTGMSRIGLQVNEESAKTVAKIAAMPHMIMEGIFTHFARADERDKTSAHHQMDEFNRMIELCKKEGVTFSYHHCSNSAGIVDMPEANMDIVRAGITLYGLWPSDEVEKERIDLQPVLSLKSHVAFIKKLEAGREIGDGYARGLSNKGEVLIHGQRAKICGRVCMDQFMVDVTDIPQIQAGDEVTLVGTDGTDEITLEELGDLSGRFNYEFACCLGKRIPRVFYKDGKILAQKDYFEE